MSRSDYPAALAAALDRFDAPPLSAAFADRVLGATASQATTLPPPVAPRRDRRGVWRRVRQTVMVTAALGMTSAAAVASGLLGAAGIQVPVLSDMLAPEPAKIAKAPVAKPKPKPEAVAAAKPEPAPPPEVVPTVVDPVEAARAARLARIEARRAERQAFLDRHPGMREAIMAGKEARRAYFRENPEAAAEVRARVAAARAAMIERRRARLEDPAASPLAQLTPEQRAARIEAWRARRAEMRALRQLRRAEARAALQREADSGAIIADEGNDAPVR